ncbi:MAG: DUF2177 family protein [Candidatus Magasanikiibacteriota bacterium]
MINFLKQFVVVVPVFLILDGIWLLGVANKFYKTNLGLLMRTQVNWLAVSLAYLFLVLGIIFFILPKVNTSLQALGWGALFGFISYGIYDMTNMATLNGWTWKISIVDMIWGAVLCGLVSMISVYILNWFK